MKMNFIDNNRQYSWIAAAVGVGTVAYGAVKSGQAKKEAKKLEANRPQITESPYLQDQYRLAQSELARGGSGVGDTAYNEMADRQFSSSIGSLLKGGGSVNNISEIFDSSDQGRQRYAMMRENLRMNQIANLNRATGALDVERGQMFDFNANRPWQDKSAAVGQARQQAQQTINSGVNTAASAFMGYAQNQRWGQGGNGGGGNGFSNLSGNTPSASSVGMSTQTPGYNVGGAFAPPGQAPSMQMDYTNFNIPAYSLNGMNYNLNEIPQ